MDLTRAVRGRGVGAPGPTWLMVYRGLYGACGSDPLIASGSPGGAVHLHDNRPVDRISAGACIGWCDNRIGIVASVMGGGCAVATGGDKSYEGDPGNDSEVFGVGE